MKRNVNILHYFSHNRQTVKSLLERSDGSDVNKRSTDGMTPLGVAAFWGYADIVQLLLEHG